MASAGFEHTTCGVMLPLLLSLLAGSAALAIPPELITTEIPVTSSDDGVQFQMYSRNHPRDFLRLEAPDLTDFKSSRRTVFMIHGFTGSGTTESVSTIRDAVLEMHDVNFVAVHWEQLAVDPYPSAAKNTTVVAGHVASMLDTLVQRHGVLLKDVQIVGFSLGAQVAGLVANTIKSGRISRITALDPARPLFNDLGPSERLDAGDADLVVVLHSAGGFVSFTEPLGHVDFYPNGGFPPQKPCETESLNGVVCSHQVAPLYFADAIRHEGSFVGVQCTSWKDFKEGKCKKGEQASFGLETKFRTNGSYYMYTAAMPPYGMGEAGLVSSDVSDNALNNNNNNDMHREGRMHDVTTSPSRASCLSLTSAVVSSFLILVTYYVS